MLSLANARMRPCKKLVLRILQARAYRGRTTPCACPSIQSAQPAASRETSFSCTPAAVALEQQTDATASWRIPRLPICAESDPLRRGSIPWGVWCLAAAAAGTAAAAQSLDSTRENQVVFAAASAGQELPVRRHAVADAVERASPWVVNVVAGLSNESATPRGFDGRQHMGSGFVVSEDGLVVTNAHVVERYVDGAVVVTFNGGEQLQGKVQAMDRKFDLALVKVDVPPGRRLPVAEIGCSVALRAGEFVVAMGSPKGLANTCTLGIVSTTARARSDLVEDAETSMITSDSTDFIQTDAAIASGNSGGPLIDLDGRVIGINTLKLSDTEGVGFAIPIDTAWKVIQELRTRGWVDRPQLGLRMVTADTLEANRSTAVMILGVTPGGPADKAGLRLGDVITDFDGKEVAATSEVLQLIGQQIGRAIRIGVQRDGAKLFRITVVTESDRRHKEGDDSSSAPSKRGRSCRTQLGGDGVPGTNTVALSTDA